MRIVVNTIPFKNKNLFEIIPLFSKNGFKDIELHVNHFFQYNPDINKIKGILKKYKINVLAMSGGWCSFWKKDIKKTEKSIEKQIKIMDALGCNRLRIFLGILEKKDYTEEIGRIIINNLTKLSNRYPKKIFLFETHDGISLDIKIMKHIFSNVNKKNILINFDAANLERAGTDSYEFLKQLYPWIGHLHIKGLKSRKGRVMGDFYCPYGEGIFSYNKIFEFLKQNKFKGLLSIEFEGKGEPLTEIKKSYEKLKRDIK